MLSEYKNKYSSRLPASTCKLGADDDLRSAFETYKQSFSAKRVLETCFLLSGRAERDQRKVFSILARHTKHGGTDTQPWNMDPDGKILFPGRFLDKDNQMIINGVLVNTDEVKMSAQADTQLPHVTPAIEEFYLPYSMQAMEDLSWNLNQHKVLPLGYNATSTPNTWLNGTYVQPTVDGGDSSLIQLSKSPAFWKKYTASSNTADKLQYLTSTPILTNVFHDPKEAESECKKLLRDLDANLNAHNPRDYSLQKEGVVTLQQAGEYHVQISKGHLDLEFANTGDAAMKVDLVVHKVKTGYALDKPLSQSVSTAIAKHYGDNWMKKRSQNLGSATRTADEFEPKIRDIITDPTNKFLPASCRLHFDGENESSATITSGTLVHTINKNDPSFIDEYRHQVIVPGGKRKTLSIHFPKKSYNPLNTTNDVNTVLNEHGYQMFFSVCGVKARTIVTPDTGDFVLGQQGPKQIGKHHAPVSFKVHGTYHETIVPAVCVDPQDNMEQRMRIETNVALEQNMQQDNVRSALYVGQEERSKDGRYTYMLTDGEATEQRKQAALDAADSAGALQKRLEAVYGTLSKQILSDAPTFTGTSPVTQASGYFVDANGGIYYAYPGKSTRHIFGGLTSEQTTAIFRYSSGLTWKKFYLKCSDFMAKMSVMNRAGFMERFQHPCMFLDALNYMNRYLLSVDSSNSFYYIAEDWSSSAIPHIIKDLNTTYKAIFNFPWPWGVIDNSSSGGSMADGAANLVTPTYNPSNSRDPAFIATSSQVTYSRKRTIDEVTGHAQAMTAAEVAEDIAMELANRANQAEGDGNRRRLEEISDIAEIATNTANPPAIDLSGSTISATFPSGTLPVAVQNTVSVSGTVDANVQNASGTSLSVTETNTATGTLDVNISQVGGNNVTATDGTLEVSAPVKYRMVLLHSDFVTDAYHQLSSSEMNAIQDMGTALLEYMIPNFSGAYNDRLDAADNYFSSDGLLAKVTYHFHGSSSDGQASFAEYKINLNGSVAQNKLPSTDGSFIRGTDFQWVQI